MVFFQLVKNILIWLCNFYTSDVLKSQPRKLVSKKLLEAWTVAYEQYESEDSESGDWISGF